MARELDATTETAGEAAHVLPYMLVEMDFESGASRVTSLPFDLTFNGDTYTGIGRLGSISPIQEGPEMRSYGLSLRLSGIPPSFFRDIADERFQDRACRVWLGFLDTQHRQDGIPVQMFGGRMDTLTLEYGETITAILTAESRLVDWERPRVRRYTNQDQQRAYPGDRGLEYVQATADMELIWGRV